MTYSCCNDRRREIIERLGTINGIAALEVIDHEATVPADRQRFLRVSFILPPAGALLSVTPANVRILGGERERDLRVLSTPIHANVLDVELDRPGDFSPYRLRLVDTTDPSKPLGGLDPLLSEIEFSFKVECRQDFDCAQHAACPPAVASEPELDYLARDYDSFRRIILDRFSLLSPAWTERHEADLGVALAELLAYVGDRLSYRQDAVATEAYLHTALRRTSVRRHVRLVDYRMHDGASARVWVQLLTTTNNVLVPAGTPLVTRLEGRGPRLAPHELDQAVGDGGVVFETMHPVRLFTAHERVTFYTWGGTDCCLPRGATSATLRGALANLQVGDVLILEEEKGATSGKPADADRSRRHAVRVTRVDATASDPLGGALDDPTNPAPGPVAVTEIEWGREDALPFPFCLSVTLGQTLVEEVSVARGNIVLADHGRTVPVQELEPVPKARLGVARSGAFDRCAGNRSVLIPVAYRPRVPLGPISQVVPLPAGKAAPAARGLHHQPENVRPAIDLFEDSIEGLRWSAQADLLRSGSASADFVVEVEDNGTATLRFGDGLNGRRPAEGTRFLARYRVGSGVAGNIGANTLEHVVSTDSALAGARNLLPAAGGAEPETIAHVRQHAPTAFRTQLRAVTPADYARFAGAVSGVQRARATHRWTGSWHTVMLAVDRLGGGSVDQPFEQDIIEALEPYRMAGEDVEVMPPRRVALEIDITITAAAGYFRADVEEAVRARLGSAILPNGRRAFFHPDELTFGTPVHLSRLYAAVSSVPGVAALEITKFQRLGAAATSGTETGVLTFGPDEIPTLDNDPNHPERGVLRITTVAAT